MGAGEKSILSEKRFPPHTPPPGRSRTNTKEEQDGE